MQWLKEVFLGYLKEWEASVRAREDLEPVEQKLLMLSPETLQGIRITGKFMYIGVH